MKQLIKFASDILEIRTIRRITSVLFILGISATIQAQSLIPELSFKNPVLLTGKGCAGDGQDGAVYIFKNAGWGLDALVTIVGRSSNDVSLAEADKPGSDDANGTGYQDAWQPVVTYGDGHAPANQSWWMEFRVSFVKHDHLDQSLSVNQFFVSGWDIDGDGNQLHEFQSYYKTHSYSLEHHSAIFASSVQGFEQDSLQKGKRFDGPTRNGHGVYGNIGTTQVSNFYTGCNSMVVRLGAETGKSPTMASERMYGLLFRSLAFDVPEVKKTPAEFTVYN